MKSRQDALIVIKDQEVDVSRASYDQKLSSTALDEREGSFHVTYDRILFQTPANIIRKVLETQAYQINIENLLACLDELKFGVRVDTKGLNPSSLSARGFLPCLYFKLPKKAKMGPLLKRFYAEIDAYEKKLDEAQKKEGSGQKVKSTLKLEEKIKLLEDKNKQLESELKVLKLRNQQLERAEASAHKALISQNILPPQLRLAKVKSIDWNTRMIEVKAGRKSYRVPLVMTQMLPEVEQQGVLYLQEDKIKGAFFYEATEQALRPQLAEIVFKDEMHVKVRDGNRCEWIIKLNSEEEKNIMSRVQRGDFILVYIRNQTLIKFEPLDHHAGSHFVEHVNERMMRACIKFTLDEGI